MNIYIRSISAITPATHPAASPYANAVVCADPDLHHLVDPKLTRRMSHVIKMGVGAALDALKQAGIAEPDAILTGTAYGCLDDTGIFLKKQVQQQETMLTPTAFIQSTHNTVGGQIGLMLHCHAYNNTFVHRGFSFEHALHDAMMLLQEGHAKHILAGAVDELTTTSYTLLQRFGLFRQSTKSDKGYIGGEGAAFFVLSNEAHEHNLAVLKAVQTLYKPSVKKAQESIYALLQQHGLATNDIALVTEGKNGDKNSDALYDEILSPMFTSNKRITFKNECGEYPTASAIALVKACGFAAQKQSDKKHILIYNHYENLHHSIYLVEAC